MSDFYVGYLPHAPRPVASFVRRVVVVLGLLLVATALVLVFGQMPFDNSAFEYGKLRTFEGIVEAQPYPTLVVQRPGAVGREDKYSRYLMVAPGKHAADDLVAGFDGKQVQLQGRLIYREGGTMIEVVPGSIGSVDAAPATKESIRDLGPVTVYGEIVDSKCYLGVMNPGRGKVHRDCAARCLSGGIAPMFVSSNGEDQYLLVGPDEAAIGRDALREFVAEPITLSGELLQRGGTRLLRIDAGALRHTLDRINTPLPSKGSQG
ncbi:MAG: hypothetical protein WBQ40_10380 [Candidatus Sulfotelmatobacter sp.]